MSDAISADGPDDRAAFEAIVTGLDWSDMDHAAAPTSAAAAPAPAQPVYGADSAPAVTEPPAPTQPEKPEFATAGAEKLGLAMTMLMAGVGQFLFYRSFFGGGLGGTVLAFAVAACFEVLMIGATGKAMERRRDGEDWRLLLAFGAFIAVGATALQLLHWMGDMAGVGVAFALASFSGWAIHAINGNGRAKGYRRLRADYDAEIARLTRKAEDRADAEYERALAERETTRQAIQRAATAVEPDPPTAPQRKPRTAPQAKKATGGTSAASGKPKPDRAEVVAWAVANSAGSERTARHFRERGFHAPEATVRGWLKQHREQ